MDYINKIINFNLFDNNTSKNKSRYSLVMPLLVFYLIISLNLIGDLNSGQLAMFIKDNRYVKHIMGLTLMTIILSQYGNISDNNIKLFVYTIISYSLFIFTTKMDLKWSMILVLLLLFGYIYENKLISKELDAQNDTALKEQDKNNIRNKHDYIKFVIMITIIIVIFIGMYQYYNKKQIQYGGNFDITKFFFEGNKRYFIKNM